MFEGDNKYYFYLAVVVGSIFGSVFGNLILKVIG